MKTDPVFLDPVRGLFEAVKSIKIMFILYDLVVTILPTTDMANNKMKYSEQTLATCIDNELVTKKRETLFF